MNSFELITKYLPEAQDKYFIENAKTAVLEQGSKYVDVNFSESGYVKIASVLMDGLSDYYKAQTEPHQDPNYAAYSGNNGTGMRDGFTIGGVSVEWEIFKLQFKRGKQFRIDYIDNEETAGVVIGSAIEEFNRVKVIPEVDASRFSIIADTASVSLGNLRVEDIDANTIIGKFNNDFAWLSEHEVPAEEQIIFVNPSVMAQIRSTTELAKFLTQDDYRNAAGIDFTVSKYMGRPIIEVPSNRFFTDVLLTDNGYRPQTSSKWINYMIVSAKAVVPIRKLEWNKIYGPEMSGLAGFHGYLIDYLIYHGVVVPKNKVTGVVVSCNSTTAATAKSNLLSVDTRAGSTTNHWFLNNYFSNPAGLRGYIVAAYYNESGSGYAKDGFVLGDTLTGTAGSDYLVIEPKADQNASTATKANFALVDASGKFIAVANQVTLAKK